MMSTKPMNYKAISQIPLFRSLEQTELERILSELKITETLFNKGDILASQDEPCNRLILLLTGSVKAEMSDPSGKVVKVEDITAPNPLAILFLFGQSNRFPVQATAREQVTALVIPRPIVLKMLGMNQTVLKNYLDVSSDFATRLSRKLHLISFRTIRQKMAVYLLELSQAAACDTLKLDKTKSDLAEYFGVTRPSLERELTRMQQDGLIAASKREITIKDKSALSQLLMH